MCTILPQDPDNQRLIPPAYERESKRSSIDSSNTVTCGRSARSDSTNSTTISLVSTEDTKDNSNKSETSNVSPHKNESAYHRRNLSNTNPENITSTFLYPSNASPVQTQDTPGTTATRSTTNSPKCKEKRKNFRMGSTLALSIDASHMHYPLTTHHDKFEDFELYKRNCNKQNVSTRGFSPKKYVQGKPTKSPTSNRKSIFSTSSKSNYNSLEEDHSRKSSMSSVGSGISGEKDGMHIRKGIGSSSNSKYLSATGRPLSGFAQSSPSSPTRGHPGKKSNLLALSRATPSAFTSINVASLDRTTSKSTSASPKNSPATKRSLFVSVQSPYKAVSMDDGHFHGAPKPRRNESVSSSSSERSSQSNLLQLPSTSYKNIHLSEGASSDIIRSGHQELNTLWASNEITTPGAITVNVVNAPNDSTVQCGCDNISCPFCNLMMSLEFTDPSVLQ